MFAKIFSNSRRPLVWLALAALTSLFTFGRWMIPGAAILEAIFLVQYLRSERLLRGMLLAWLALSATASVASQNVVPIPFPWLIPFMFIATLMGMLPYLADRLLAPRLGGLLGTLVLPAAMVAWLALDSATSAYGSWGSPAYSLAGLPLFLQGVSLVGMWSLVFVIFWTASLVVWAGEQGFRWLEIRRGALAWAGLLAGLVLFGAARLALAQLGPASVQVAAVVPSTPTFMGSIPEGDFWQRMMTGQELGEAELEAARAGMLDLQTAMLEASRRQAQNGARIVFWAEGSALVLAQDEAALIERGQALAQEQRIYLGMALATLHPGERHENKLVLVEPSGAIAWNYHKTHLVENAESPYFVPGDGVMPVLDTPYGRIGAAICHDMDHHQFVQQAGAQGVDLLFIPTGDWKEIDRLHLNMAAVRAAEQGVTVVRPARGGITAAIDPLGRVIASLDTADARLDASPVDTGTTEAIRALNTAVPAKGVASLYTRLGDLFAWANAALFAGLAGLVLVRSARRRIAPRPAPAGAKVSYE